eukprot:COSAG02_NODE_20702_length_818_cov_1.617524_1_plen_73_part_00
MHCHNDLPDHTSDRLIDKGGNVSVVEASTHLRIYSLLAIEATTLGIAAHLLLAVTNVPLRDPLLDESPCTMG